MSNTDLVVAVAVVLGVAGGLIAGLVIAGARLSHAVRFLEELLDELEDQRARLAALLGELELEKETGHPPANQ